MKTFAALALVLVPTVFGLTIDTPLNVVECQPYQFTVSGGQSPYFISLQLPNQGAIIKQFPEQEGTTFTWLVDLQANTNFNAAVRDSTGAQAFSGLATITAGSDTSCLNTAVQDSGSGTASSVPSSTSASGISSSQTASSTSSASASSPSNTNAATIGSSVSTFGIAGLFGLVGAALF